MSTVSKPPSTPARTRKVSIVPESEARIVSYIDRAVDGLKTDINTRMDKQDASLARQEGKLDALTERMSEHQATAGHQVTEKRLDMLEEFLKQLSDRPLKTWQIVTGAGFLIFTICGFTLSFISFVFMVLYDLHIIGGH